MTTITFLLISGMILSSVCQIGSIFLEKNSKVLFNFNCYENHDPVKVCSSYYNYKSCKIFLNFCIKSKPGSDDFSNCDVFSKTFNIINERGMCKKGKYDSRDYLKDKNTFTANLKTTFIYIKIEIETDRKERSTYDTMNYINLASGKHVIRMNTVKNIQERLIDIKLNVKVNCLPNFHGNNCESYCFDLPSCSDTKNDRCTNDWNQMRCHNVNFTEKAKYCRCIYSMGNYSSCSKEYKSCLDELMKCQNTSQQFLVECKKFMAQTNPFEITYLAVGIGIGGLIVIIVILLFAVLFMWRRKNKMLNKRNINNLNSFEMERSSIKNYRDRSNSIVSGTSTEYNKCHFNEIRSINRPLPDPHNSSKTKSNVSKYSPVQGNLNCSQTDNAPPLPKRTLTTSTSNEYEKIKLQSVETGSIENPIRESIEGDSFPIKN